MNEHKNRVANGFEPGPLNVVVNVGGVLPAAELARAIRAELIRKRWRL